MVFLAMNPSILLFSLLVTLVGVLDVCADILEGTEDYSDVPAPLRYNGENVTLDVNRKEGVYIPYAASIKFLDLLSHIDYYTQLAGSSQRCYANESRSQIIDQSVPGSLRELTFETPEITKYKINKPYENMCGLICEGIRKSSRSILVEFHTSWKAYTDDKHNITSYEEIVRAFTMNTIFNMTFNTGATPKTPEGCPTHEYYPVPLNWCNHSKILYAGKVVQPMLSMGGKYCVILFADQINHYMDMWNKGETFETSRRKCTKSLNEDFNYLTDYNGTKYETEYPDFYNCHKTYGENSIINECYDPKYTLIEFSENGKGQVREYSIGRNDENIDINITIEFTHWTADFVKIFSHTFRDCDFAKDKTNLKIVLFVQDIIIPPERGPPWYLWILFGLLTIPVIVLLVALFFLMFVRSRKGFRLEVWDFQNKKKMAQLKKQKQLSDSNTKIEKEDIEMVKNGNIGIENGGVEF